MPKMLVKTKKLKAKFISNLNFDSFIIANMKPFCKKSEFQNYQYNQKSPQIDEISSSNYGNYKKSNEKIRRNHYEYKLKDEKKDYYKSHEKSL